MLHSRALRLIIVAESLFLHSPRIYGELPDTITYGLNCRKVFYLHHSGGCEVSSQGAVEDLEEMVEVPRPLAVDDLLWNEVGI